MTIQNNITDTKPLFAHCQGNYHFEEKWIDIVNEVIPNQKEIIFPDKDKITIITFVSGFMVTTLDRQLKKSGIEFIDLAQFYNHTKIWTNQFKIIYTNYYLKKIKTPYVLSLDAIDVLACEDLAGMITRFEEMNCDILFGASINNHPHSWAKAEDSEAVFKYLNAGTMLGKTDSLIEFYAALDQEARSSKNNAVNNEQEIIKKVRTGFENVKSDTGCKIFQTLGCTDYDFKDNIITVKSKK